MGLKRGQCIDGRYELVERLGRGGMGTVWEATHVVLGRPVALKLINALDDDIATRRFLAEARSAAKVSHRNIVAIHDFGVTEWGAPYMVMERLNGMSLGERLAVTSPSLTISEFLELICQGLMGLSAVHAAGLIHRDLKPDNLFLAESEDQCIVKLLDFGLTLASDGSPDQRLSQTGAVLGTPAYMSPEQVRRVRDLDVRCDIYSLGVILYEGLSGTLPFGEAGSVEALVRLSRGDHPQPLSESRPEIGCALSELVERAT
jgi:serine/threonine-protein kinase